LNDALYRANRGALWFVIMTFALNAGISINDVQNAIALADGLGWAFGKACTTGNAFFSNFHSHGKSSPL
jgi:hypothetical protein